MGFSFFINRFCCLKSRSKVIQSDVEVGILFSQGLALDGFGGGDGRWWKDPVEVWLRPELFRQSSLLQISVERSSLSRLQAKHCNSSETSCFETSAVRYKLPIHNHISLLL